MTDDITIHQKLDVRMQISLSRKHLAQVKQLKPKTLSLSAYVRQAVEEKMSRDRVKILDVNETISLLRKPLSKAVPSISEVNQRIGRLRQERKAR